MLVTWAAARNNPASPFGTIGSDPPISMGDGFQFLDIILFALIAAFLVLRLRSVLGRRDGHQGPPAHDPFRSPPAQDSADDKVVRLPDRTDSPPELADDVPMEEQGPLETGLAQIKLADPSFESEGFLGGACKAFDQILRDFAAGDADALEPLLSPEVLANFSQSIREREEAGEQLEVALVGIKVADIVEAYMAGRTAHVTVKFVTEQISVVKDEQGDIVEGDPNESTDVTDFWTFARDTNSGNPNWFLVATGTND